MQKALSERSQIGALRELMPPSQLIDFCSNDYLGFAKKFSIDPSRIVLDVGSSGSRLISGNHPIFETVEGEIASFHNGEAALLFSSGYLANLGLVSAVARRSDTIIYDELCHASIRDGLRLTFANSYSFAHNDLDELQEKIAAARGEKFVVVESVYSVDGDFAPLKEIAKVCKDGGASLIVDEAHSTGVFGSRGEGLCCALGIETFARVHTFGKALGRHGAAIVGSKILREYLVNFCRPFIFTTAMSPQSANEIRDAYERLKGAFTERDSLLGVVQYFRERLPIELRGRFIQSFSPIQCMIIPGNEAALRVASKLQQSGFDVRALRSPTVPAGQERIRICLHSFNSKEQISGLIKVLCET